MGPLAVAGIGYGVSAISKLFGSGDKGVPQWLINMIETEYKKNRTSGYLPDETLFNNKISADTAQIMSALPVNQESFNADLASRGIFSSGEAPKYMYSDVYAPLAKTALSNAANVRLSYAQQYQQGMIAAEQQRTQLLSLLVNSVVNKKGSNWSNLADYLASLGEFAGTLGVGKKLGLFGDDSGDGSGLLIGAMAYPEDIRG